MCKPQSCKIEDTENQGNITHQEILHLCSYECKWDEIPDRELKRIIIRMFKEVSQGVQISIQHSSVTSASFVCSGHCLDCLRYGLWSVSVRQTNSVCTKEKNKYPKTPKKKKKLIKKYKPLSEIRKMCRMWKRNLINDGNTREELTWNAKNKKWSQIKCSVESLTNQRDQGEDRVSVPKDKNKVIGTT